MLLGKTECDKSVRDSLCVVILNTPYSYRPKANTFGLVAMDFGERKWTRVNELELAVYNTLKN